MIHKLKIEPQYLENLINGRKKSEIRLNDRDYQIRDVLAFRNAKYDPIYSNNVPETLDFIITHIHSGLGLLPGYVVLSVERLE